MFEERLIFFKRKEVVTFFLFVILFLVVIFIGLESFFYHKNKNNQELVKFGLITDVHCYSKFNKKTNEWEMNWRCSRPLEEFTEKMNGKTFNPDFVIQVGDMADGRDKLGEDGFLKAREIYEKINVPKYYVLGNHETRNLSKERWREIIDYQNDYYYFDVKKYRFIVLDANNVEVPLGSGNVVDMTPNTPHSYKGMMDDEQMKWLEEVFEKSDNYKKIVFIHEPPFDETIGRTRNDTFVNPKPLRDLFSKYQVKAVFAGHIEELCDVEIEGVQYFSLQGFHKRNDRLPDEHQYKDKGAFYQIILNGDEIEIEMFFSDGKEDPYQSIKINQETAICNNETLPSQD